MRSLLLLSLVGCATTAEPTSLSADLAQEPAGAITVLAGGAWGRTVGCPSPEACQIERNFWVDLAIRNDAYDKRAGIVWIDRVRDADSAPWHVAAAIYEGPLANGYEQWGVDVTAGVYVAIEPDPEISLAAFVEMAGTESWDNRGGANYQF
jgi:hypothetical protein